MNGQERKKTGWDRDLPSSHRFHREDLLPPLSRILSTLKLVTLQDEVKTTVSTGASFGFPQTQPSLHLPPPLHFEEVLHNTCECSLFKSALLYPFKKLPLSSLL